MGLIPWLRDCRCLFIAFFVHTKLPTLPALAQYLLVSTRFPCIRLVLLKTGPSYPQLVDRASGGHSRRAKSRCQPFAPLWAQYAD
jgi:hypothetical protein